MSAYVKPAVERYDLHLKDLTKFAAHRLEVCNAGQYDRLL